MARPQQGPRLLLAIVGALVALSYQTKKKSFIHVQELPVSDPFVVTTLDFVSKEFNKKSEDKYNFRIVRVLKAVQVVSVPLPWQPGHCGLGAAMQQTQSHSLKWACI